jgi:hypothetical protein
MRIRRIHALGAIVVACRTWMQSVTPPRREKQQTCAKCNGEGLSVVGVSHALLVYLRCNACGHAATIEHPDSQVVSDLANALQAAVFFSVELEAKAVDQLDDVGRLRFALERAVTALRKLRR